MKLSPASEAVVRATAAAVAENAEAITRAFYPDMFAAHPELMRVFNAANQAIGEQPKALAASSTSSIPTPRTSRRSLPGSRTNTFLWASKRRNTRSSVIT